MKGLTTITFLALFQTMSAQQSAKASIEGMVLRAGTEEPVAAAHVTLTRNEQSPTSDSSSVPNATTDSHGRFVLDNLDPGAYRLSVASNGFVKQEYGQRVFPGRGMVLSLRSGDSLKDLVVRLSPGGTLSGHVRDSLGAPAVDVPVQLFRSGYREDGTKRLQLLGGTKSDDRGEYRFYWLTPDTYFIYAGGPMSGPGAVDRTSLVRSVITDLAPTNKVTETYRAEFYRNVADLKDATPVRIQSGDVLDGIDFTMSPQIFAGIHGRIIDISGGAFSTAVDVTVQTWSPDEESSTYFLRSYYNADKGTFDIPDLAPGTYAITAARTAPAARGSISVNLGNTDLNGVLIQIGPPLSISGRVTFDNPETATATFELRPVARHLDRISGTASRDGSLKFDYVQPGDYWLICTSPTLFIKTAQYGTEDVSNQPMHFTGNGPSILNIVLSSKGGQVRGVARDSENRPSKGSVAVLVPRFRERADRYKTTTTDQNGGFTIVNVPPGDYTVFVFEAIEQYSWFDPDLLTRLESLPGSGSSMHISENSVQSIDLRVIPVGNQR